MRKKEAHRLTGGLSKPGKMPGYGWGIPASMCKMGGLLSQTTRSVCHKDHCYAKNGMNRMPTVQAAQYRRFVKWKYEPKWIEAMATLIDDPYFRWFDTGDLQSRKMLMDIIEVAKRTSDSHHYLPTKEYDIINVALDDGVEIPDNLRIRISSPIIDQGPSGIAKRLSNQLGGSVTFRTKWAHEIAPDSIICKAQLNSGNCGDCRACWDEPQMIAYPYHKGTHKVPVVWDSFQHYRRRLSK